MYYLRYIYSSSSSPRLLLSNTLLPVFDTVDTGKVWDSQVCPRAIGGIDTCHKVRHSLSPPTVTYICMGELPHFHQGPTSSFLYCQTIQALLFIKFTSIVSWKTCIIQNIFLFSVSTQPSHATHQQCRIFTAVCFPDGEKRTLSGEFPASRADVGSDYRSTHRTEVPRLHDRNTHSKHQSSGLHQGDGLIIINNCNLYSSIKYNRCNCSVALYKE